MTTTMTIAGDTGLSSNPNSEFSNLNTTDLKSLQALHQTEAEILDLIKTLNLHLTQTTGKIIQLISSTSGEGTTTIGQSFAAVSAIRLDKKVLLISEEHLSVTTLDKPAPPPPETDDPSQLPQVINQSTTALPQAQSALLYSPQARQVFQNLRQLHDIIIIDSPALTRSNEGLAIAPHVDGTIIILEAEKTRWSIAKRTKEKIIKAGGTPLGLIFNKRHYHIPPTVYKFI